MKFIRIATLLFLAGSAFTGTAQRVQPNAPIDNFRLPCFADDGSRTALIRGTESRITSPNQIEVTGLNLALFSTDGSNKVETVILSPAATVLVADRLVRGESPLRVVHDDFEITGTGWTYNYREKSVSLHHNVRVVFHEELKDLIK